MKYISYVRYALIVISAIVIAMGVSSGDVDAMLRWTEGVLIASFIAVLVLSAYSAIKSPQGSSRSLIGFVGVVVILGVSYAMADTTPIETPIRIFDNPAELITTDTGLYATYIVSALAVLSILCTEVYNLIKK